MKRFAILTALAVALTATLTAPRSASADFTVCNQYRELIYVAYGYDDGIDWVSEGWWSVDPGQCTVVYSGAIPYRYLYLYGETEDGATTWTGTQPLCIEPNNGFQIWGNYECYVNFIEIDTGNQADWTHTLTP